MGALHTVRIHYVAISPSQATVRSPSFIYHVPFDSMGPQLCANFGLHTSSYRIIHHRFANTCVSQLNSSQLYFLNSPSNSCLFPLTLWLFLSQILSSQQLTLYNPFISNPRNDKSIILLCSGRCVHHDSNSTQRSILIHISNVRH